MKLVRLAACAVVSLGLTQAATLFTNLPSDGSWGGYPIPAFASPAVGFTPSITATLDSATVLAAVISPSGFFDFCIASDALGQPDSCLETVDNQVLPADGFGVGTTTVYFTGTTVLTAGTPYWLVISLNTTNSDVGSYGGWYINSQFISGPFASGSTGNWTVNANHPSPPSLQVDGTPVQAEVPEPGSFALAALSAFALATARHLRR